MSAKIDVLLFGIMKRDFDIKNLVKMLSFQAVKSPIKVGKSTCAHCEISFF